MNPIVRLLRSHRATSTTRSRTREHSTTRPGAGLFSARGVRLPRGSTQHPEPPQNREAISELRSRVNERRGIDDFLEGPKWEALEAHQRAVEQILGLHASEKRVLTSVKPSFASGPVNPKAHYESVLGQVRDHLEALALRDSVRMETVEQLLSQTLAKASPIDSPLSEDAFASASLRVHRVASWYADAAIGKARTEHGLLEGIGELIEEGLTRVDLLAVWQLLGVDPEDLVTG